MDAIQASHSKQQAKKPGNTSPSSKQSPPPTRSNIFKKLWHWWSAFTGPKKDTFPTDIFAQEQLRRARLVSALLILVVIVVALLILSATVRSLWIPTIILLVGGVVIAFCNRAGHTTLSSIFYVLLVDVALVGFFYFKPVPALSSGNMTGLDLFILAVLVGGVILPKGLIPFSGILQVLLICVIFFSRPHDASLTELIQRAGNDYVALMPTLVLHVVGTTLAWLHAWSVERALIRASQAEELAEARSELSQQALLITKQKQRLEEGISSILEAHRQIAAGNLAARAPVHEDQELWQIGHALNLMLMRIQQQAQDYRSLQATYKEIDQLINVFGEARAERRPALPPVRTPLAQRLLVVLRR
ncbi:HAMP domain-containing protein [Dictyobacter kobayashii]|uniref:HAMP domain-containing protein n=1 Tax=Dictyobacter kobayashii TaxID=2014872 RepID=A0A402AVL3_9CHLR|nr:HAMP domain-containing protein [Dictyobacter kobayashii]GCE23053.1 hypothetical protein KDK_68530 [Dictyobacter kobayashii]